MEPKYVSGHSAWVDNIPFAFELIKERKPEFIVELGVHYGDSYFAFCQAVEEYNLYTKCFGIDLFEGDDLTGYYGAEVYNKVMEYNTQYQPFSTIIRSSFDEACSTFKLGSIDILHIDGSHYYEEAKHDLYRWLPKVKTGGIVLLHDINVIKERYGVHKLWKEIKATCKYKEINNQYGLGVLYV